jgi:hypothetical protein
MPSQHWLSVSWDVHWTRLCLMSAWFAYFHTLNMEAAVPPKHRQTYFRLYGFSSQKAVFLKKSAAFGSPSNRSRDTLKNAPLISRTYALMHHILQHPSLILTTHLSVMRDVRFPGVFPTFTHFPDANDEYTTTTSIATSTVHHSTLSSNWISAVDTTLLNSSVYSDSCFVSRA